MDEETARTLMEKMPPFDPALFPSPHGFTRIGTGSPGSKALGLAAVREVLEERFAPSFRPDIDVRIPPLAVITTDLFDSFVQQNDLHRLVLSDGSDDEVERAFREASLPRQLVHVLRTFLARVHLPLAVRSSSLLEDDVDKPLANVYSTSMVPNNQADTSARLEALLRAIKRVYASTYFRTARNVIRDAGYSPDDQKMAVVLQEVVGSPFGERFYPHISGVLRSYNFYPTGLARPEEGLVHLALGLGRTIVEDGIAWVCSPAHPYANPPYTSVPSLLKHTQKEFWAIDMRGSPQSVSGGVAGTDHLRKWSLAEAEQDGALRVVASTYKADDDRIVPGIDTEGPRIVDFAPILKHKLIPLDRLLPALLETCEETLRGMVEVEFAVSLGERPGAPARFGFLQLRPMAVSQVIVDVPPEDLVSRNVLLASESVLGNGLVDTLCDVVYVRPERFDSKETRSIAGELETINRELVAAGRSYILIGFGRWGTTDPQCGIPVVFGQISGAKVLVESTLPDLHLMLSQGTHFFHNLVSSRAVYFSVEHGGRFRIDWEWLGRQPRVAETPFLRHVRALAPLTVKVDGRTGRGVISHES
ncbi:MAG: PEP/pyruvate-binding domain-containing protein [Planctomycetota bacterium]